MAAHAEEVPTIPVFDTQELESQDGQGQPDLPTVLFNSNETEGSQEEGKAQPKPEETPQENKEYKEAQAVPESQGGQTAEAAPSTQVVPAEVEGPLRRLQVLSADDADEMMDMNYTTCKKCNQTTELQECVVRGPSEMWCKACNALYVMLKRNMSWPPAEFEGMTEVEQQQFFVRCQKEKELAKKSQFSYQRVRETLHRVMVEEQIRARKVAVGGTYLPLSVYRQKGYEIDSDFENRNPRQWSYGLNAWTYLLVETTIKEQDITNNVEKSILQCEKNIKKRKEVLEEGEKDQQQLEAKCAKTDATVVMDLVTESEDEGRVGNMTHISDM